MGGDSTERLLDFIPRVSPNLKAPKPLAPYCDTLDQAIGGNLRVVFATPPQHGKTLSTIHAIVKWLKAYPHLRFIYATYSQDRADRVAHLARRVAMHANLKIGGTKRWWNTDAGGFVIWTSLSGGITGEGVDGAFIVDDPYKNRKAAESPAYRKETDDNLVDVVETRVHPGASIIVMATRWHPQDISGKLIKQGWKYINLKAIADGIDQPEGDRRKPGAALWPDRMPLQSLRKKQKTNQFSFASLYQGMPRPRGGNLFGDAHYYEALPDVDYRIGYGIDLAYTKKTSADFSVCMKLRQKDPFFYIAGVWRRQVKAPTFMNTIKARQRKEAGRAYFYGSGVEKGSSDFMRQRKVDIKFMSATVDKFQRSQPTAEAWNDGLILLPDYEAMGLDEEPEWVTLTLDEVQNFTGVNDPSDDIVDALVSGHDGMKKYGPIDFDEEHNRSLPALRM